MVFFTRLKPLEIFIKLLVKLLLNTMPGHMFQIFGAVIAAVSPRVLRTWYPKTVEEKFCLGAFGVVILGRFVEIIKMNINKKINS